MLNFLLHSIFCLMQHIGQCLTSEPCFLPFNRAPLPFYQFSILSTSFYPATPAHQSFCLRSSGQPSSIHPNIDLDVFPLHMMAWLTLTQCALDLPFTFVKFIWGGCNGGRKKKHDMPWWLAATNWLNPPLGAFRSLGDLDTAVLLSNSWHRDPWESVETARGSVEKMRGEMCTLYFYLNLMFFFLWYHLGREAFFQQVSLNMRDIFLCMSCSASL